MRVAAILSTAASARSDRRLSAPSIDPVDARLLLEARRALEFVLAALPDPDALAKRLLDLDAELEPMRDAVAHLVVDDGDHARRLGWPLGRWWTLARVESSHGARYVV